VHAARVVARLRRVLDAAARRVKGVPPLPLTAARQRHNARQPAACAHQPRARRASATGSLDTRRVRGVGFSSSWLTRMPALDGGPSLTATVSAGRGRARRGDGDASPLLIWRAARAVRPL